MIDEFAKEYLHNDLRDMRAALLWKLDGLSEYDVRRPLTATGTNLLGLVKHLSLSEARYFGEVFDRPFPAPIPSWDDLAAVDAYTWARADESRAAIIDGYRRACDHADETIAALAIDAPGHVPWWPRPDVKLFNVMVHILTETSRHAGHADILREQVDGVVGTDEQMASWWHPDAAYWAERRATIEHAAQAAPDTGWRASSPPDDAARE
jgi:hypothetical protein